MRKSLILLVASFLFFGAMQAQGFHYTPDGVIGSVSLGFWCQVNIDGVEQTSSNIEVGLFMDGVCKNTQMIQGFYGNSFYRINPTCSHDAAGATVTFKLYNHETEEELDNCSYTYTVTGENVVLGSAPAPIVLDFSTGPVYPAYPWVPNYALWNDNSWIVATVQINGQPLTDPSNWEVGAFSSTDDLCRGDGNLIASTDPTLPYSYYLVTQLYGNNGDDIYFLLYDKGAGEVLPGVCEFTIDAFQNGIQYGDFSSVLNFVTTQTFTKNILAYTGNGGYYLIASPIGQVDVTDVENMITESDFDLYYFDQSGAGNDTYEHLEWINYELAANEFTTLEPGKGYLYANSVNDTLVFTGVAYNGDGTFPLDYDADASLKGWNLVGNPFAERAYIDRDFYIINEYGSEIITGSDNSIKAMEGVFVKAQAAGETVTFSTTEPAKKQTALVMNVTRNRGTVVDRAILRFDETAGLPKFQLNSNNTKLYIPQNGMDYAVIGAATQGEMPVNFKAAESGVYTLSFISEGVEFNYLHLIDNMTGADVDLLAPELVEGPASYTFEASTTDYATRFKLVFATGDNSSDDNFAFYSNGNFIINNEGEATLQVVDVMGRIIKSETINGSASVNVDAATGVYMLRLINGNDVKVQKVVVR